MIRKVTKGSATWRNSISYRFYIKENNNTIEVGRFDISDAGTGEICNVHIYSKYRNQGYGSLMAKEIAKLIAKRRTCFLLVFKSNIPALKCYAKAGFRVVNIYQDTYLMQLKPFTTLKDYDTPIEQYKPIILNVIKNFKKGIDKTVKV